MNLKRPLVFFDLETTGTNIVKDRIIEISWIKLYPGGREEEDCRRINPGIPIPPASTAVHHITDADVAEMPTFAQLADELISIFDDADIAGYNSNKFDIPLLIEEFNRANVNFNINGRKLIDVQNIFYKKEPRTLVAAYRFYCGKELENAHSAQSDTRATYEVLLGQIEKYSDLTEDIDQIAEFARSGNNLDLSGRIITNDKGEPTFNFGKHKGKTLRDVYRNEPSFFLWINQNDFPKDTKDLVMAHYLQFKNGKQ